MGGARPGGHRGGDDLVFREARHPSTGCDDAGSAAGAEVCIPVACGIPSMSDCFLKKLDSAYPEHHQIRLVPDSHSTHISKEMRGYFETMPQRFVFPPAHGAWLNLIENPCSEMTRTMLRGIPVASKPGLIDRIRQWR